MSFKSLGSFNRPFFFLVPNPDSRWRPILDLSKPNLLGDHQDLPPIRGVGYINRFQGYLLPYTYTRTIQGMPEISHPRLGIPVLLPYTYTRTIQGMPEISHPRLGIPVQCPAIRSVHSTFGVHHDTNGGETDGHTQGFRNPPVPRRLVGESQLPPDLSPTYTGSSK